MIAGGVTRRNVLRAGAVGIAAVGLGAGKVLMQPSLQRAGCCRPDGVFGAASTAIADSLYIEAFPVSPLILNPFNDPLLIPQALKPLRPAEVAALTRRPARASVSRTRSATRRTRSGRTRSGSRTRSSTRSTCWSRQHSFTTSQVLPINALGQPTQSFDANGNTFPAGTVRTLPPSTIYGFNGTFPGPMINAEYGKPVPGPVQQPPGREPAEPGPAGLRGPGASVPHPPAQRAHRAGVGRQPALRVPVRPEGPRLPAQVVRGPALPELAGRQRQPGEAELLLVPRPRDGLHRRRTSTREWSGSTRSTTRRTTSTPATRPRACACRVSAPTTPTAPSTSSTTSRWRSTTSGWTTAPRSTRTSTTRWASSRPPGNPRTHPEWWGKSFFKHFPNHGFVGDIFTVNGTAYPVLEVKRRKYRFRFLDCSISRIYEFQLMTSTNGPEVGPRPRLRHRGRPAGPVADRGRPAGHELDPDRRPTAACCRSRSPGTPSSCGRRSGVSTSSTSPSTRTARPPRRATSST